MTHPVLEPEDPVSAWRRCMAAGEEAQSHDRFAEAAEQYQDARALAQPFGPEDPRRAEALAALGILYSRHGHLRRVGMTAAALLEQALAIRERVLGPDHPEVARLLVHLASCRYLPGPWSSPADVAQAAAFLERALAIEAEAAEVD